MEVEVDYEYTMLKGTYKEVEGVRLVCERCGHTVEVFGVGMASLRRGCVMLRDECPNGEKNRYEVDIDNVDTRPEEEVLGTTLIRLITELVQTPVPWREKRDKILSRYTLLEQNNLKEFARWFRE